MTRKTRKKTKKTKKTPVNEYAVPGDGPVALPTGTCFEDVAEYIEVAAFAGKLDLNLTFTVHALVTNSFTGQPASHAWIEIGDDVITAVILEGRKQYVKCTKEHYYREAGILEISRYSMKEVAYHSRRTGHGGPWETKYIKHCSEEQS